MAHDRELTALDAVRLLCNAIQKVQHLDREQEGITPPCRDPGEYMLADALEYLAWGDTRGAREFMDLYDRWKEAGETPWPYDGGPPPGSVSAPKREAPCPRTAAPRKDASDLDDGIPF